MKIRSFFFTTIFLGLASLYGQKINYNASIKSSFGSSYDFYSFSENILDINLFLNGFESWVQYEYSNPPNIGFPLNDIRKFRFEYSSRNIKIQIGDIYKIWDRGLILNQFEDQDINFDNGIRGFSLDVKRGFFTFNHINGSAEIWELGSDLRIPFFNNKHALFANRINYNLNNFNLSISHLVSNEEHKKMSLETVDVKHDLIGISSGIASNNFDLFFEYVDKISTVRQVEIESLPNDTLKKGFGLYGNINVYLGSWGLTTEYKKYSFDVLHGDVTPDDYGNQISFQQMPTLGKEQSTTLLGRRSHNYNFNDERGVQYELNGSIASLSLNAQYSHLSRNEIWVSERGPFSWAQSPIKNSLPSSNIFALPYYENYQEVNGYLFDDRLYFKIGHGANKEVLNANWNYHGIQNDTTLNLEVFSDTSYSYYAPDYPIITIDSIYDSSIVSYDILAKNWKESKSFTIPVELNLISDNGLTFGINFQYQERKLYEKREGNAKSYDISESKWKLIDSTDPTKFFSSTNSQLSYDGSTREKQFNRLLSLSISKASKWSFTITQDWTSAYEVQSKDPYYNPLEALLYGDIKYFLGKRNKISPPSFIQNKWVSAELAYDITSAQKISILYGSIQGGLSCNNGICRLIPPFNDGLKILYSATI